MNAPAPRALAAALLLVFLGIRPAPAQPATSAELARARAVLDDGFAALGGRDRITALSAIAFTLEGTSLAPGQSRSPREAAWEAPRTTRYTLDLQRTRARREMDLHFPGGYVFRYLTVVDGGDVAEVDLLTWRQGTDVARGSAEEAAETWVRFEQGLPPLLLRQALRQEATLGSTGEADYRGRLHRTVAYTDPVGRSVTLFFDADADLLSKVEVAVAEGVTAGVDFMDYAAYDGLQLPGRIVTRVNGQVQQDLHLTDVELVPETTDGLFAVPAGYSDPPETPAKPVVTRLADGVYALDHMPGGYRSLIVEGDDHVTVLEAPHGAAYAEEALRLIRETVPDKPVRYVLVTHHHGDHIGGLPTFLAAGATAIVGPGVDGVVRAAAEAQGLPAPEVEVVTADRRVLGSGATRIEAYAVPNGHADGMLMFYLPEHKILFQGDLLTLPERGEPAAAFPVNDDFAKALRRLRLDVDAIVGVHGRAGTLQDLRRVLAQPAAE